MSKPPVVSRAKQDVAKGAAPSAAPGRPEAADAADAPPRGAASAGELGGLLYTADERRRRDASAWTLVQGVLAPLQFLVCAVSAVLVLRYLWTGDGLSAAQVSFVVKTVLLYTIMVTGSIWEKVVFGRWLFAPAFFWEDVVSMLVLALHTACLAAMFTGWLDARSQMLLALAAYTSYAINATQFLLKLRAARRQVPAAEHPMTPEVLA